MAEASGAVQVQFTIDDAVRGGAIADAVLADRLAACVQRVGPIRSRYHWQGRLEDAEEWLFVCKTTARRVDELVRRIADLHPYDTPEVVAAPITAGLDRYLTWIDDETRPGAHPSG